MTFALATACGFDFDDLTEAQLDDFVVAAYALHDTLHATDESVAFDMCELSGLMEYSAGMIGTSELACGMAQWWALPTDMMPAVAAGSFSSLTPEQLAL